MQAAMNICQAAWEMMGGRLAGKSNRKPWVFPSKIYGFPVKCVILCYIMLYYPILGNKRLRYRLKNANDMPLLLHDSASRNERMSYILAGSKTSQTVFFVYHRFSEHVEMNGSVREWRVIWEEERACEHVRWTCGRACEHVDAHVGARIVKRVIFFHRSCANSGASSSNVHWGK